MQTQCRVYAKVIKNAKLGTLRILYTFDATNTISVRSAVVQSGDICSLKDQRRDYYIAQDVARTVKELRCGAVKMIYSKGTAPCAES